MTNIIRINSVRVNKLPNIEKFGKNDPFIIITLATTNSISLDAPWTSQTSVQEDAGDAAEWHYEEDEATMLFPISGKTGTRLLSMTIMEHNSFSADGFLGKVDIDITRVLGSNIIQTFPGMLLDKKGVSNGGLIEVTCVCRGKPRAFAAELQALHDQVMVSSTK